MKILLERLFNMEENIIELEEYKRILELKKQLDSGEITNDSIELSDLEKINEIYIYEIGELSQKINELKKENMRLKMLKGN